MGFLIRRVRRLGLARLTMASIAGIGPRAVDPLPKETWGQDW